MRLPLLTPNVRRLAGCALTLVCAATIGQVWGEVAFPTFQAESARDYLREVMDSVAAQTGTNANACFMVARVRSQLGDKEGAEHWALEALKHEPQRPEMQAFLAEMLILQDRMEEAARWLRQALALQPDLPGANRRLGMTLDRLGDRAGAREALTTAVRQVPDDATARLVLGRLLLDEGEVEGAADHLSKACQLDAKLSGAFYALSQAEERRGNPAAAETALTTFRQLKQQEMTELDARNSRYDDEKFMRALTASFHTEVAGYLLRRQQTPLAEAHLRQAVRVAPEEFAAHEMLAGLLLKTGRLAEARPVCEALVRLRPKTAIYHVNLGTLLLQLKDYPAAETELRRALELDPVQPAALNNLARHLLSTQRDLPEALACCRRLVELQPTAASYDLLGWALYANGHTHDARVAAARAVERDPTNAVYRARLEKLQQQP